MNGAFIAVKNIRFEYSDVRLPREVQLRRMRAVMENELTPLQRELMQAVYFDGQRQAEIAKRRGVSRSTVNRTLRRAEERMRRFLRY